MVDLVLDDLGGKAGVGLDPGLEGPVLEPDLDGLPPLPLAEALQAPVSRRRTLIFGNEGRGLPPEFAKVGRPVRIPSNDQVDSLNLAIAAGIGIYAFLDKETGGA